MSSDDSLFGWVRYYGGFDRSPLTRDDFNMVVVATLTGTPAHRPHGAATQIPDRG